MPRLGRMPFLSISVGNVHCKYLHFGDECDMKVDAIFSFEQVMCIPHEMIWPSNKHCQSLEENLSIVTNDKRKT